MMSQERKRVVILNVNGHYEGYVNGEFVVSGDTWTEVYIDLLEMEESK